MNPNRFLIIDGNQIPVNRFNNYKMVNGQLCKWNKIDGYCFKISKDSIQMIMQDEYKNKFCAFLNGKLFHWFDTLSELENFQNSGSANLNYVFYYPE